MSRKWVWTTVALVSVITFFPSLGLTVNASPAQTTKQPPYPFKNTKPSQLLPDAAHKATKKRSARSPAGSPGHN